MAKMTASTERFVRDTFTWAAYALLAYYAYLQAVLGPIMPFLRAELGLSYTIGGLHPSAFAAGMILAGLLGDRIAGRYGRRLTLWGGGVGMALGATLLMFSHSLLLSLPSVFLMGFLGTLLLVMVQSTLSDHHADGRATALTEANIGASLSATLAPLFVGLFQGRGTGWAGALLLAVVVFVLLYLRFGRVSVPEAHDTPADAQHRSLPPLFWAYWLALVLGVAAEWSVIFWSPDFLETNGGLSKTVAATTMSVFFVAALVGRIAGSWLTRRIASERLLLLAALLALAGFPLLWLGPSAPLMVLGLFISGLGIANLFPLSLSVATGVAARQADLASARAALGGGLAIFTAPFVLGSLADVISLQLAFGVIGVLLATAVIVIALSNRVVSPA